MEDYRAKTARVYDLHTESFAEKFKKSFPIYEFSSAKAFVEAVPENGSILDIGAGPGYAAQYFIEQGRRVHCVDLSEEMVKLCQNQGLSAEQGDICTYVSRETYDGIWANAVLLHVSKQDLPQAIASLSKNLKKGGVLAVSVKEGVGETFTEEERYKGSSRYWSFFTKDELVSYFGPDFTELGSSRVDVEGKFHFLNILFRKQ